MISAATEDKHPIPTQDAVITIPAGNLEGREVKNLNQNRNCGYLCCAKNGSLAWITLLVFVVMGVVLSAIGVIVGVKKKEWEGSAVIFVSAGIFALIGGLFFAFIHPKGCCCCCCS